MTAMVTTAVANEIVEPKPSDDISNLTFIADTNSGAELPPSLDALRARFRELTSDWTKVTYDEYRLVIVPLHRQIQDEATQQSIVLTEQDKLVPPDHFVARDTQEQMRINEMVEEFKRLTANWSSITVRQYREEILPQYSAIKSELGRLNMSPPVGFGMNAPEEIWEKISAVENGTANPDPSTLLSQVEVPTSSDSDSKPKLDPIKPNTTETVSADPKEIIKSTIGTADNSLTTQSLGTVMDKIREQLKSMLTKSKTPVAKETTVSSVGTPRSIIGNVQSAFKSIRDQLITVQNRFTGTPTNTQEQLQAAVIKLDNAPAAPIENIVQTRMSRGRRSDKRLNYPDGGMRSRGPAAGNDRRRRDVSTKQFIARNNKII